MYNVNYYTKKSYYPLLEFSWSAALSVSSSLARPPLSLPNSILFYPPKNYSLSSFRWATVTWALHGHYATVLRNPVAHRLLISRQPLRDSHVGVARPLLDSHVSVERPLRDSTP